MGRVFCINTAFEGVEFPLLGYAGGGPGGRGCVGLINEQVLAGEGRNFVSTGKRIIIQLSGGAGLGSGAARDLVFVIRDFTNGLISETGAGERQPEHLSSVMLRS